MSKHNRTTLKSYFRTGKRPTQEQFADLIDSGLNLSDSDLFEAGGSLGLGYERPLARLSVNGNLSVSPNNDAAPDNGLFVHGKVGLGAGFANPVAQLAVNGGVYIGAAATADPGPNGLRVDGNVTAGGNLTVANDKYIAADKVRARDNSGLKLSESGGKGLKVNHSSGDLVTDGDLSIANGKTLKTDKVQARDNGGLKLSESGGKGLKVNHSSGDLVTDGDLWIANGKTLKTDKVQARDNGGLNLARRNGETRLKIHDSGHVSIATEEKSWASLNVSGSVTATRFLEAQSLKLTGELQETEHIGYGAGRKYGDWTIDAPQNKVVSGIRLQRYRESDGDKDTYRIALRYR